MYIYQNPDWPDFRWDAAFIQTILSGVRNRQGFIVGKMGAFGFELVSQANLEILTQDVLKSTEIEGEILNQSQVRSSIARRLGLDISGLVVSDRNVDGVVEMMVDATSNFSNPLTRERLFAWQSSLFPGGYSGLSKIRVGHWRNDLNGPMQVVSGPIGRENIHFEAISAAHLDHEMRHFITWMNEDQNIDLVIKAAIAHLWFVTIHPFEDGNGRIARALTDMVLSQSDRQKYRFYSMSTQIRSERKLYYSILEQTQKGSLDITEWINWFLNCLFHALENSESLLKKVIFKHRFWIRNAIHVENERQKKILNMLLDEFKGKLTTSKWAKIGRCSQDTALRDIQKLVAKGVLYKLSGGGRSTGYEIVKDNF